MELSKERLAEIRARVEEIQLEAAVFAMQPAKPKVITKDEAMLCDLLAGYDEVVEENEALVEVADSLTESLYQEGKKLEAMERRYSRWECDEVELAELQREP